MKRWLALVVLVGLVAAGCGDNGGDVSSAPPAGGNDVEGVAPRPVLLVEGWRSPDRAAWIEEILPAFRALNPDIDVRFAHTEPTEYDAALRRRLEHGLAGDVIACRPFDESHTLQQAGYFVDLTHMRLERSFPKRALEPWSTDGGVPYCVPASSVMHGFLINEEIFDLLSLEPPSTEAEFFSVLDRVAGDGRFVPLALGLQETWVISTMGFQSIGPTYWGGERGRQELIDGAARYTDPEFVAAFDVLARWAPYLPAGAEQISIAQARRIFTEGGAAMHPFGSWELADIGSRADFRFSAVAPPRRNADSRCFVSDHVDIGFGLNAASPHREAAQRFLDWVASPSFAEVYSNALPGFFSLQSQPIELENPVARGIVAWRGRCETTIRSSAQYLSRGPSTHENDLWEATAAVAAGRMSPDEAARQVQSRLDAWYVPPQR